MPPRSPCVISVIVLAACVPAPRALLTASRVDSSEDCPAGGLILESGIDDDRDEVLDPAEVDTTTFVCDGEEGTDGQDGADGIDGQDGADGTDAASFGPVLDGSYVIQDTRDVALLAGVETITGNLTVRESPTPTSPPGPWSFELPDLQSVGGEFRIEGMRTLTRVGIPALVSIGSGVNLSWNFALREVGWAPDLNFPTEYQGYVYIATNPELLTIEGFNGASGVRQVFIMDNASLTTVRGFARSEVIEITIQYNPTLTTVEGFDVVTYAGEISVSNNTSLRCLDPALLARFTAAAASLYVDVGPCER